MSVRVSSRNLAERDHYTDRFRGIVTSALPASVEPAPQATDRQLTPTLLAAARPDWWTDGTLPGVMAGKRPER